MRKALVFALLASTAALAAGAALNLDTAVRLEMTDCASGGTAGATLTVGNYLLRVTDADAFLCYAASCATGGEKFPQGSVVVLAVPTGGQAFSCRSAASNADVILTKVSGY
jgi:hypothetical protein